MQIIKIARGKSEVVLNVDELRTLSNAMNEVCNGIDLEGEFETRMGVKLEQAKAMLESLHELIREVAREE